jgi:hypothetical protein
MKPIILTGHFGSGKTEIAINLALKARSEADEGTRVALIDLDLVNPYFRSREAERVVREAGIQVVLPPPDLMHSDLPVIPRDVFAVLNKAAEEDWRVIIDLGGDDQGALVLGHLRQQLLERGCELWVVVNPYRPFNQDLAGIEETVRRIEAAGRIRVTGLVSNPHLTGLTQGEDVRQGHRLVEEAAKKLRLPIRYLAVKSSLLDEVKNALTGVNDILSINCYLRPDWFDQ